MDGSGKFTLSKYDTLTLNGRELSIGDDSIQHKYVLDIQHQQSLLKQGTDQLDDIEKTILIIRLLKTLPDEFQEKVWKELYDDPSYQELEKENYSLKAENEELKGDYQAKNEAYLNLKYGR